ncbi:MAG: radical SAM protein [Desulfatitalea sp.]|nr:radical SAM protein [Desulfatitalea sp.]NNK00879.1 radical SAM protein [Desulfatitalea sp.]
MRVLLVSANTVIEPYPVYPLGLDYVTAALAQDHHDVVRLDMNDLTDDGGITAVVNRFGPDVIGLSLRNIDNTDALRPVSFIPRYRRIMAMLRAACDAPVVLGGSGFTLFPEALMRILAADFGIVGEGERMRELLAALQNGQTPIGIPGIIERSGRGVAPVPLGATPLPAAGAGPTVADYYLKQGGMLNLQTKRGCPFRCIYCSYPHIEGRTLRGQPPEQLAQAALARQQAGARYLFVTDSAFNADSRHSLEVARAFKAAGLTIPWGAFFAPVRMPDGYFHTLAECGLEHVEFGTEALDNAVLRSYGKPFTVADVFAAHMQARDAGLHVAHYFLFAGPGEDAQTVRATLENIEMLEKTVLFLFCGMRIYPHTALYRQALAEGQLSPRRPILAPVFYRPAGISIAKAAELIETHARGRVHWVHAGGGQASGEILQRMYRKGYSGPLWEFLAR